MNISEFCDRLHTALSMRGLSEEEISDCIAGIVPSIGSSSVEPDSETFDAVVTQCVEIIENKRKNVATHIGESDPADIPSFGDDSAPTNAPALSGDSDGIVSIAPVFGVSSDESSVDTPALDVRNDDPASVPASVDTASTDDTSASVSDSVTVPASGDTVTIPSIRSFTSSHTAQSEVSVPVSDTVTADTVTVPVTKHISRVAPPTAPASANVTVTPVSNDRSDDDSIAGVSAEESTTPVKKVKPAPVSVSKVKLSAKGRAAFIGITVLASPLWGLFFLVFFLPFIILFVLESLTIAALIAGVAGISAAGTAASLTGIVYGVIRSFAVFSEGLYEIGFGVIVAGVTMIVGILLFNAAVRFMPWLFKKTAVFAKFLIHRAASIFSIYKRRFEKF